jgi:hypothetical protein
MNRNIRSKTVNMKHVIDAVVLTERVIGLTHVTTDRLRTCYLYQRVLCHEVSRLGR